MDERESIVGDLVELFLDRTDARLHFNRLWLRPQTIAFVVGFATAATGDPTPPRS